MMALNPMGDQLDFEMMDSSPSDQDASVHDDPASEDSDASTVDSEGQIPRIERTKSQIAKQLQVHHIVQQVAGREDFINELQGIVSRLEKEGVHEDESLHKAVAVVTEAQKEARNLGEDLMEDLLTLDSLSNLIPEDRMTRKKALSDIEALLGIVDEAKVELGIYRKKLEAKLAEQTGGQETGLARLIVELPHRNVWEQLNLAVHFHLHEECHCYAIEASVADLDRKDLTLRLDRGESVLMVEGLRLPTSAETSEMKQLVTAQVEQFAQKVPVQFARSGGLSEMSKQAFLKLGQGHFGYFSEKFEIPNDVVVGDISATYDDGKLEVVLPKKRPVLSHMAPSPATYLRHHPFRSKQFQ
jgi:HSP20 family molecular chaperone IbpA